MIRDLLQRAGVVVYAAAEPAPDKFTRFYNLLSQNATKADRKVLQVQGLQVKIDAGAVVYGHRESPTPHWTVTILGKRKDTAYGLEVGYVHGSPEQYKLEYNARLLASWPVNNNPEIRNIEDLLRLVVAAVVAHEQSKRKSKPAQAAAEPEVSDRDTDYGDMYNMLVQRAPAARGRDHIGTLRVGLHTFKFTIVDGAAFRQQSAYVQFWSADVPGDARKPQGSYGIIFTATPSRRGADVRVIRYGSAGSVSGEHSFLLMFHNTFTGTLQELVSKLYAENRDMEARGIYLFRKQDQVQAAAEPATKLDDVEMIVKWQKIVDFFAQPKRITYKRDGRVFIVSKQPSKTSGPKWFVRIQLEGNRKRTVRFQMERTYYKDLILAASYDSLIDDVPCWDFGHIRNTDALSNPQQFVAAAVQLVDSIPNHVFAFQPEPVAAVAAAEPNTLHFASWRYCNLMPHNEDADTMQKIQQFCIRKRLVPLKSMSRSARDLYMLHFNDSLPRMCRKHLQQVLVAVARKFNASPRLIQLIYADSYVSTQTVHPDSEHGRWLRKYGFMSTSTAAT